MTGRRILHRAVLAAALAALPGLAFAADVIQGAEKQATKTGQTGFITDRRV